MAQKREKKLLSAGRPAGTRLISSQRYRDPHKVEEKRENHDYTVTISPPFDLGGETYQIVIDGHHSLGAALEDDETPDFVVATPQDDDRIGMLENGDVDGFLEAEYMDDSWYDLEDEVEVW